MASQIEWPHPMIQDSAHPMARQWPSLWTEKLGGPHSKAWFGFTKAHQVPQTCQCFSMGGGAIDPWHIPVPTESCQLRAANGRLLNAPVKMVGISQESQKNLGARIGAQFLRH